MKKANVKKLLIILLLFALGWVVGILFHPKKHIPKEENTSSSNWIPPCDLYDYEEAVLKNGDKSKLFEIIGEADVERLPYIIAMYDVYRKDVCIYLLQIFSLYSEDINIHKTPAMIPMRVFVDSVVSEYERCGEASDMELIEEYKEQLKEFGENEQET